MKKIFVIDASNVKVAEAFVNTIRFKVDKDTIVVPNAVFVSLYEVFYGDIRKTIGTEDLQVSSKLYASLEEQWFKINKERLIAKTLEVVDERDTPRTILFIYSKNRILFHYIRLKYGYKIVKSLQLITDKPNEEPTIQKYKFSRYDIRIDIPEFDNRQLTNRLIGKFINAHIPVKLITSL